MDCRIIAKIYNDFPTKFGLPRQSGLCDHLLSEIIFEDDYRDANALKGIEEFSHLWLIWYISEFDDGTWSPTVRPPKLGGNKRLGVFATRSPYRPNPIGLTCVKLVEVRSTSEHGKTLIVSGADIMSGTPILDIKPYIPYSDCINDAAGSFSDIHSNDCVNVDIDEHLLEKIRPDAREGLLEALAGDPRPGYKKDSERVYGFYYADAEIKFTVSGNTLRVTDIQKKTPFPKK